MFGRRKSEITEDHKDEKSVIGRAEIKKQGDTRHVKSFIVLCLNSKTIYTANYETSKNDIYSYREAVDELKRYIEREGLELEGTITTNVQLPYVKNTSKKTLRKKHDKRS